MKETSRRRSILHLDLDPFFVSVERRLDRGLKGRPLIVGAAGALGVVAAASVEARTLGVRAGQPLATARRLCPDAVVRPGDLEAYAAASEEVGAVLAAHGRRFERPSADEAYLDLTPDPARPGAAVPAAEALKDEIQKRLGLDVALGLAGSRIGARVASALARPRGLLVVLPGYERSFIAPAPLSLLADLPPQLEDALARAGFKTLGQLAAAPAGALEHVVGATAAARLRAAAVGDGEEPIPMAAPPPWVQEEVRVRDQRATREDLLPLLDGLAARACRRVRAFGVRAGSVTLEVRRGEAAARRSAVLRPGLGDDETATRVVRELADPLLEPASGIRSLLLRLGRFAPPPLEAPLFPGWLAARCYNPPSMVAARSSKKLRARPGRPAVTRRRVASILDLLEAAHPEAECALHYQTPFQLVVATILSAQCTDERVNLVTPELFRRYPTPATLAAAAPAQLESIIRSTGFFRAKSRSLLGCAQALVARHDGHVPRELASLVALPGIGRKTANVVLGHAFGIAEGIAVDTHVLRVSNLGIAHGEDPVDVEAQLMALVPHERWTRTTDLLIFHGRKICEARRPRCDQCPVFRDCRWDDRQAYAFATPAPPKRRVGQRTSRSRRA